MKKLRKVEKSDYLLVRAYSTSTYNECCNFAIVVLSQDWIEKNIERYEVMSQLSKMSDFCSSSFFDMNVYFLEIDEDKELDFEFEFDNKFTFVEFDEYEDENFIISGLDTYLVEFMPGGYINYTARNKYDGETLSTVGFSIFDIHKVFVGS